MAKILNPDKMLKDAEENFLKEGGKMELKEAEERLTDATRRYKTALEKRGVEIEKEGHKNNIKKISDYEKITMLTHSQCPHCAQAKQILQCSDDSLRCKNNIQKLEIDSKDISERSLARGLVEDFGIKGVPTLILEGKNGTKEECQISRDGSRALCKDKEVLL